MPEPDDLAGDFAEGIVSVDSKLPIAVNSRSGERFQAGLGPHSENEAIRLVFTELHNSKPSSYSNFGLGIPYPESPRQRCDACLGEPPAWKWAIEAKLVRFLGDNGKPNNNMLMHLLSPFAVDRSAVTDCVKLARSSLGARKAVLVYGFDDARWPLETAAKAFEALAGLFVRLGPRAEKPFSDLVHPVHNRGAVFVWEVFGSAEK